MSISTTIGMDRRFAPTAAGTVAYAAQGQGHPALFIHGVFFNADIWQHQLGELGDLRRCIAVDLLAHGQSDCPASGALDLTAQARMVLELADALDLGEFDLVGNDSGGAIAQLVVAKSPGRVSSLVLTNCDTHDNWPPEAFQPLVDLARAGALADAQVDGFFGPFRDSRANAEALQAYVASMDSGVTVAIRDELARFASPTLIVWGTDDVFFDVAWARWLAATIPGTTRVVELEGARLFFPMERVARFNEELRAFWAP
jgi:pimeloyl-ACP methyl ester carboxylesterase